MKLASPNQASFAILTPMSTDIASQSTHPTTLENSDIEASRIYRRSRSLAIEDGVEIMSISLLLDSFPRRNVIKLVKHTGVSTAVLRAALGRHSKNLHFHSVLPMPIQHLSYRIVFTPTSRDSLLSSSLIFAGPLFATSFLGLYSKGLQPNEPHVTDRPANVRLSESFFHEP